MALLLQFLEGQNQSNKISHTMGSLTHSFYMIIVKKLLSLKTKEIPFKYELEKLSLQLEQVVNLMDFSKKKLSYFIHVTSFSQCLVKQEKKRVHCYTLGQSINIRFANYVLMKLRGQIKVNIDYCFSFLFFSFLFI